MSTPLADELSRRDACAMADLVRAREVAPRELVMAAIERIERVNPKINAVVTTTFDLALEAAETADVTAPFPGVPFLLKDLGATCAGVRHTAGSRFLRNYVAERDTELVSRLKRAGLAILGTTNTAEFGNASTTEPRAFGPTRNPWDPMRTAGGSSGGSGASVAAGLTPMAHGSDGGGSIRVPASCCGLFGLKPTRGRNPVGPDAGEVFAGLVVEHGLTRSVRDSAGLLDATTGPAVGAPYFAPPAPRPFRQSAETSPPRLRIAFAYALPGGEDLVEPDCRHAVLEAAHLCEELGHAVVEEHPDIHSEEVEQAHWTLWAAHTAAEIDAWERRLGRSPHPDELEPLTWELVRRGRCISAPAYLESLDRLHQASRRIGTFFESFDIWLTPTLTSPPVLAGSFDAPDDDPYEAAQRDMKFAPLTPLANISGQPAMSLPLYWNASGLPIGCNFVGRYADDSTLFQLAAQLEKARPWADRWPALVDSV